MSSCVIARGVAQSAPNGIADGAIVSHGSGGAVPPCPLPSHGALRRALASGMGELDGDLGGADTVTMVDDARERRLAGVGIEPEAAVADAAVPLHVAHFRDHKPGAGIGQHAEMRHGASRRRRRHWRCTGTSARRRCGSRARDRRAGSARTRRWSCNSQRYQAASRSITGASSAQAPAEAAGAVLGSPPNGRKSRRLRGFGKQLVLLVVPLQRPLR